MARIKKYSPQQNLSSFQTFILDDNPNSDYFRITEFKDTFTGGKNGFLIEGSEYLKESTEIKIELLDVNGDPIYFEPGNGIPEYYEGISKVIAVYIYEDTPIGLGKITILGELKQYDDNGVKRDVPSQWQGAYNVKWQRTFQINKNLANEDKVRFYRRPKVQIDEIVKPIFNKTPNIVTQTGIVDGTPLVPNAGSKLSNFSLPTSYRITTADENYWTGSVVGQTLTLSNINYTTTIQDVVSKTELVVDPPYAPNNIVSSFSSEAYSVNFVHLEGVTDLATALTGSFAKIKISDMNTFVGDAARVKVFRKSQSQLSDYEFVQEIQLESNEVLRDIETVTTNQLNYGQFTEGVTETYWVTSSNDLSIQLNQDFLYNSIKFDSTGTNSFFTSQSFDISSGVEYTLTFNVRKNSNSNSGDYVKAFLGSTPGPIVEDTTGAIACSTAATYTGGESYPTEQSINLGENTGTTNLQYNAINVPDRFIVEWDGSVVIDSGYVGGTQYDFGGASRSTFTAGLLGRVDPITGNTYPDLTTYPDDGYPRVTTATSPLPAGSGSGDFNKTSSSPQLATTKVYAPLGGTAWDLTLNCPLDPPVTDIERISNPTTIQNVTTVQSSNSVLQKTPIEVNFLADDINDVRLYFEIVGDGWYISDVSLKASQETSFSPDVITFIQQVPKTLPSETFDYRFEFYDINNNYIPVLVEQTKTFDGGNLNLFEKSIEFIPDQLYFAFDSASNPLPPTIINFDVVTTLVTGSVNYSSQSFDFFGNELSASEFAGGQYPGLLRDINTNNPFLTVSDFTGSRDDLTVQYVRYTAEVEGVSDTVIITRVQDGQGGVNFEIRPYRGTVIKNKSDKDLEIQAIRIDGVNEIVLKENLPQPGFSDAKLRVLSSSLDPITLQPSGSYILLSEASSSKFIRGLTAGTTGSGEINYNAKFNRDAITNELVVFLMDGEDSGSILTSIILTDTLDGLGSGFVQFSAEQFSLQPRLDTEYNPTTASVTASFQDRFSPLAESFISGCLMITPSASIDVDFVTHYYMFYETGTFDRRVSVRATNLLGNPVYSGIPGQSVNYYTAEETKQLNLNFTYVEDITSASVSVDKTFYIVPEGKPGDDAIVIDVDPRVVQLSANQRGAVYDYGPLDTNISVKQGRLDLVYESTQAAGTFRVIDVVPNNIYAGTAKPYGDISASFEGYSSMPNPILSASIRYDLEIHPYFTSSYFTQSVVQKITKAIDGAAGIDLFINPIAVNFSGDEDGNINDYASGNTTLIVKQGDEYLTFDAANIGTPGTFTCSIDQTGIQVGEISASARFVPQYGDDTLHFLRYDQMPYTTASVDYNVTIYPFSLSNGIASSSIELTRTQIFSKAVAGKRARSVKLNASTRQVVYDGDDIVVAPEGSVILSVGATGFTGSAFYQFFRDGFPYSLIDDTPQYEISSGDSVGPGQVATWQVQARDGSPNAGVIATDELTISGVKSGGDGYTVELSNPSPVVPVQVDGTVDLSQTNTTIRAYKSSVELTHVSTYSSPSVDFNGDPIGSIGEFSSSLESLSVFLTQPNIPSGNPAFIDNLTGWTDAINNLSAEVIFKVDIENGRAIFFKTQSLSVSLEGAVGPGIVFRGEYSNAVDYIYSVSNGRRDAVLWDKDGDNYPETYYIALQNNGPASTVVAPTGDASSANYWEEMGTEELFVAAKIAIFEESFVKNTINVGQPATAYAVNPQITIYGGDSEPYISVGQGTQGYGQQGIFIGVTEDGGPNGTAGTAGLLSIEDDTGDSYLRWDGYNLEVKSDNVLIETTNLTIDSQNELISIGSTGYDTDGIWLGRNAGASRLSLKNGTTSYLKWDGTGLGIKSDNALIETTNLTIDSQNELISIGQSVNEFTSSGIFLGIGASGESLLSLKSTPAGGSYNSLEWDGSTLTIRGAVRQTAAGIVEGSLRGVWASGTEYYPNDIVTYNGQSWVMIGTTHTSTNDTNATTGRPDTATNSWQVAAQAGTSGTAGTAGAQGPSGTSGTSGANGTSGINGTNGAAGTPAGIVYAGAWNADGTFSNPNIYLAEADLKYVTKYTSGATNYWVAATTHRIRGTFDTGNDYEIDDVVKYNDGGGEDWYICIQAAPAASVDPSNSSYFTNIGTVAGNAIRPGTWGAGWTAFGAEFTSVATDILFAQDVYADKTVNVGSKGGSPVISLNADAGNSNANPFISIGQSSPNIGFTEDGIYFGYKAGSPVLSMVTGSTFFIYESGSISISDAAFTGTGSVIEGSEIRVGRNFDIPVSNPNAYKFTVSPEGIVSASQAYISGSVQASDGRIGNWVIDPIDGTDGGSLRDENSEIIFEPNIPEIQVYSDDGTGAQKRVWIGSVNSLSSTAAVSETVTWSSAPTFASTNVTSNASSTATVSTNVYTSNSTSTPFQVYAGLTTFGDIDIPDITAVSTDIATLTQPTVQAPFYSPTYEGQVHGGFDFMSQARGQVQATLYLEVVDTNNSNAVIGSAFLGSAYANGERQNIYGYVGTLGGGIASVTGNTELMLSDGTTILAKDITKKHKILVWDEVNKKYTESVVSEVLSRSVDSIFRITVADKVVDVSDTHGFWIDGGEEIKVKDIIAGETKIYVKDGDVIKFAVVDKVEEVFGKEDVYTLSVPKYMNYISNGIISHNIASPSWNYEILLETASANSVNFSSTTTTKSVNISTTTSAAALRYRLLLSAKSTKEVDVDNYGGTTDQITQNTNNFAMTVSSGKDTYFGGSLDTSIQTDRANNFVEIQGGGVQVVSNNDRFVRMTRRALSDGNPELFRVSDGTAYFTARTPNSTPYPVAIESEGDIVPAYNGGGAVYDLGTGSSTSRWKNLNGMDISGLADSHAAGPGTSTGTTYNNSSTVNRDSYVVLPGGTIIQWGYIYDTGSNPKVVVFPTAFPNAFHSGVCSTHRSSDGSNGFNHIWNINKERMSVVLDGSYGFWIAFGY